MPPSPTRTPTRKALHERSDSQTNIRPAVRLVPYTPPRLSRDQNDLYSRTPLPTLPSHFFPPAATGPAVAASYPESAFALLEHPGSGNNVSADLYPPKPQASPGSSVTTSHQSQQGDHSRPSTANSSRSKSLPRKRKHVALNPDNKTFRVLDVDQQDEVQTESGFKSPSSTASFSSHGRLSFDPHGSDAPVRSPTSWAPQSTAATTPDIAGRESTTPSLVDHITNSPWNYRFVGGLRKVPKTPDLKQKAVSSANPHPPPLPEISEDPKTASALSAKPSFQSDLSTSTASETSNYQVYGSSPTSYHPAIPPPSGDSDQQLNEQSYTESQIENYQETAPPSSSESNYHILSYSSPALSEIDLPSQNYQLYGELSRTPSHAVVSSPAGPSYSRESLIVPPLQPKAKHSTERFGYYKSRSRESLRTGSLTSISSVLGQEAAAQGTLTASLATQLPSVNLLSAPGSWAPNRAGNPARTQMQPHPHTWSSQLSTVPSESDAGTDRESRSWSDGHGRRSSGFPSFHSRQMASISSSSPHNGGHSRADSLEYPQPILARSSPRLVEGQDEHGDGITDMQDLRMRTSRPRLSDFYSVTSDTGRTNTMRSTTSSRANSLLSSSIPTWARLYYGSGERRYLGAPGSSTEGTDSRPQSSMRSGSPDSSNFPLAIYSPRRRPRQINPSTRRPSSNRRGSMEITPLPELGNDSVLIYNNSFRRRFRPSSSILSPHLKRDRRATRGSKFFSEPASVNWSTGGGMFSSRRGRLILMFIVGFIFPVAWIVGAFLPLPPNPQLLMIEDKSNPEIFKSTIREFGPTDETRYENARWWRNLNRGMAVLGVVIITAIVILVAIGLKQDWAK